MILITITIRIDKLSIKLTVIVNIIGNYRSKKRVIVLIVPTKYASTNDAKGSAANATNAGNATFTNSLSKLSLTIFNSSLVSRDDTSTHVSLLLLYKTLLLLYFDVNDDVIDDDDPV